VYAGGHRADDPSPHRRRGRRALAARARHRAGCGLLGLTVAAASYLRDPARTRIAWRVEHLISMLAAGIAVHTAFAVFFLGQMLGIYLPGPLAILPWILPTLVGVPTIIVWARRERRRLAG
jgi:hypothetical protein